MYRQGPTHGRASAGPRPGRSCRQPACLAGSSTARTGLAALACLALVSFAAPAQAQDNTPPTASNNTVTTNEDTAHSFAAAEFNFSDTDSGDMLSGVEVVSLPTVGTLALNTTPVTPNQDVAASDIGSLVFTPAANANGAGYASFTFKVSDGMDKSADAYTMTVNVTAVNDAPEFSDATLTREVAENSVADVDVGAVIPEATDADNNTLEYSMEGTDEASFNFDATTRQITTKLGVTYNFEATKNSYSVTIKADDGNGGTGTVEVTISLTDVEEPPDEPDDPTVSPTPGSTTSLDVSWEVPNNDGRPAEITYDLRYRVDGTPGWDDGPQDLTGTSATITGLTANTTYDVQVRATNAEGDSPWSDTDERSTSSGTPFNPPVARVLDNWALTPSSLNVGDRFRLLSVSSNRRDASASSIAVYNTFVQNDVSSNGHADIRSHASSFRAIGCSETVDAIINTGTPTSNSSVSIHWLGGAKVADNYSDLYDGGWDSNVPKHPDGTDAPNPGRVLHGCISSGGIHDENYLAGGGQVAVGYPYTQGRELQGRLTGSNTIDRGVYGLSQIFQVVANTPPTASDNSVTTDEDTAHSFAAAEFNFSDTDSGHTLALVEVVTLPSDGALTFDGDAATVNLDVAVADIAKLVFTPAANANGTGYASFTFKVSDGTDKSDSAYTMTVNVTEVNDAPSFTSSATFDAAENQTAVGTVAATDGDSGDSVTGYAIEGGADRSSFSIADSTGVLTFASAPNFEGAADADGDNDYVVVVRATSGTGAREKTADQTITVTVTDVAGEAPGVPAAPSVSSASVTSVTATWTAPSNAGPAITDYDYRHRVKSPQGSWTAVTDTTSTALSATIAGLAEDTEYEVQVRATSDEGTSGWSASGSGSTDAEAQTGICGRTEQVRDAIVGLVSSVTNCADVTDAHLAAITGILLLDNDGITALAAGDFDELTALTSLSLSSNSLSTLPAGVFDELTALESLNLHSNSLTSLPDDVFDELTALESLNLNSNSLSTLPAGVFDELTALELLNLHSNSLTSLPADVFENLTALKDLHLYGNSLSTLPAGVFDELTALTSLGLGSNELSTLPAGVFDDLTALTWLYLQGNPGAPFSPTADAVPDDGTVLPAGGTVTLDGSGSGGPWGTNVTYSWALTDPASGVTVTFDDAASATPEATIPALAEGAELTFTLTVTGRATNTSNGTAPDTDTATVTAVVDSTAGICGRTEQVRDAIVGLVSSVTNCADVTDAHLAAITGILLLDNDGITALAAGDFDELTALTSLSLSSNSLSTLPAGVFDELTALESLNLHSNSLTSLPDDVFDELTALESLNLNSNSLSTLPAGVFDELTALELLNLHSNSLTSLPADVFENLTALKDLHLYGNSLSTLPAGVFDELTALTSLGLGSNELSTLPAGVFDDLTALTWLYLQGNPGAPFSPTADAVPDDGTVLPAGGTVTLDGSGSGGPWGTNVTYSWALTDPASGVTVTFDDAASATPEATIPALAEGAELTFTLTVTGRATNTSNGTAPDTDTATVTAVANAAPSFTSSATFNAAENQTAVGTVAATDGDSGDSVTGYAIHGGADRSSFSIVDSTGVLTFASAPNFEGAADADGDNDYVVVVRATSGTGARESTADQTITVTVTNVAGEAPGVPAAPSVSSSSVTSVTATWAAPSNAGPAITDYDYRHRVKSPQGSWTEVTGTTSTALSATIAGLAEDTEYEVQVRATSDEGTSGWSASGSGSTDANAAPSFTSPATFDAAENQTAVGTVAASDSDTGDSVTGYAIHGGADASKFSIAASTGVLTFASPPNFEAPADADTGNDYVVVVRATSGTGARESTADQTITVTVTDVAGEAPGVPAAPSVSSASLTSVTATWTAPSNAGPAITDYDYRHRVKSPQGSWTEVTGTTSTALSATIAGLAEDTEYEVQVRATSDEGTSGWSASGSGSTDANAAPVFSDTMLTRSVAENSAADVNVGPVIPEATDADAGATLEYSMEGADAASFNFDVSTRQISTRSGVTYNFEATKNSYSVTIGVSDGTDSDTVAVTINLTNVIELPSAPTGLTVSPTLGVGGSLDASWTAPTNTGEPAVIDYDLQYATSSSGPWSNGPQGVTGTSSAISGLNATRTRYYVRVSARNVDGDSAWSGIDDGFTGTTTTSANCPAPTLTGRARIWSATVSVGNGNVGQITYYGFNSVTGQGIEAFGSLSDTSFQIGTNNYTVRTMANGVSNNAMFFTLDSLVTDSEKAELTLHVCNMPLALSSATVIDGSGFTGYEWPYTADDWPDYATRNVYLSVPSANSAPTATDGSVTTDEDTAHTFAAGEFSFADTDSGDELSLVEVVTLPSDGTLTLDGTDVTVNLDVPVADIGDLVFTPAADANGTGYASFTFKVSDGTDKSADAYTMTVNVTAVNDAPTGLPTIGGTARVGRTLTAATTGIEDVDGLTGVSYTYQWVRVDNGTDSDIASATSSTYTLVAADQGDTVKVEVSFTDDGGSSEELTSAATGVVAANTAPTASNGTVTTDEDTPFTFSADLFYFSDSDPGDMLALVEVVTLPLVGTLRLNTTPVTTNQEIAAADIGSLAFTPAANANGDNHANFTFRVSDGLAKSALAYTVTVNVRAVNDAPTGLPTISGAAQVGATLTAVTSGIEDADGLTGVSYAYQWVRVDSGTDSDIAGATDSTYTLVVADEGNTIKVEVSFTDEGGRDEGPLTSAETATVVAAPVNAPPTASNGTVTTDEDTAHTFEAANFNFADTDGDTLSLVEVVTLPSDGALTFDGNAATANLDVPVADIGDLLFTPAADANGTGYASFTFKVGDGTDKSDSAYTMTVNVTAVNDAPTGLPTISGTAQVGATLTAVTTDIADADGLPASFTYQWVRVDGSDETDIASATGGTYTPVSDDLGKTIRVKVSFTDDDATDEGPLTSAETATIEAVTANSAPAFSDATLTREVAENSVADVDVGAVIPEATDADNDTLEYSMEGTDEASFNFNVTTRQITTKSGVTYNFEATKNSYSVTIRVSDGTDSDTVAVTINLTNVIELPSAPTGLEVAPTLGAGGSLDASWTAPANTGEPAITGYKLQYATSSSGPWSNGPQNVTGTSSTITTGLAGNTLYYVRVLATNSDGDGAWSSTDDATTRIATTSANCPAPTLTGRAQIWSATVSVETGRVNNGLVPYVGFNTVTPHDVFGALSDTSFQVGINSYTVRTLATLPTNSDALFLGLDRHVTDTEKAELTLHVCDDAVALSSATQVDGAGFKAYQWTYGVDWSDYATREAYLSVPSDNSAPTASNGTITTDEDMAHTFAAGEFSFADTDSGDTLSLVEVVTLPSDGTLTLDGADVTVNQDVTKAQIDADDLVFTPAANANGDGYASFTFKVSDGTDKSADAYTMTVNVTAVNDAATGLPTISGTAQVGATLTAATTGIEDVDGLTGVSYSYQWVRVDSGTDTDISGATSSTYTLVGDDEGNTVKVEVSFTDDAGNSEELTSAATGEVAPPANTAPTASNGSVTTDEDTAHTFAAAEFNFADTDGDTLALVEVVTLPSDGTLTFDGNAATVNLDVAVADIGTLVFTPAANANGDDYASFTFKVSDGTDKSADAYTMTVNVTAVNDAATGLPTISGTAQVGETLTAATTGIEDADGLTGVSYAYQWVRVDSGTDSDISGATDSTYMLVSDDEGKTVKVEVSFTDDGGTDEGPLTSAATGEVAPPANTAPDFSDATLTREVAENTPADTGIGDVIPAATDAEGNDLVYSMEGADEASFAFDVSTRQISTRAALDHENKDSYSVTIRVSDGTLSDTVAVTINVTDVDEPPDAPGAPSVSATTGSATSLDVSWTAPDNAGKPAVTYFLQYRVGDSGNFLGAPDPTTGTSATIADLAANTDYEVQVMAENDEGKSDWSESGAGRTGNTAPAFSSDTATRGVAENSVADTDVGEPVEAADADNDTLTYTLGGADRASFAVDDASGQIATIAGVNYDFEGTASYAVTVTADDGNGATDTIGVTIDLTDVDEPPTAPAAPSVSATTGSATSLDVSWTAPGNDGKPAITSYDLQYRVVGDAGWTAGPQDEPGTRATIDEDLTANTDYEVQVLATNEEGDSDWSAAGEGTTGNTTPAFDEETAARSVAENTPADTDIGAALPAAADADLDTLIYSLGGTDATSFAFDAATRQLSTLAALDFEAKASYSVTIQADDDNGGTDTIEVTIAVTDVDEPPDAPAAPSVAATAGSTTSLNVSWTAPGNDGRPTITGYDLQYRVVGVQTWTAGSQDEPGTSATIEGVTPNSDYEVQVRARNNEGESGWSESGTGNTGNTAPVFGVETAARSVAENTPANTDIGTAFPAATDTDGDTLIYSLEGADEASFAFDASTRQLSTLAALDFETKATYAVTVRADDSNGGSDTIAVTVSVTNVDEPPDAPGAPSVAATPGSTTGLDVEWSAPGNDGRPEITGYDLQYRVVGVQAWTAGSPVETGTSASIAGLTPSTGYEVQVSASNEEGDSGWSAAGTGSTGTPVNSLPVFSNDTLTRSVAENTAPGTDFGAVIPEATDADSGDILTYSLEGTDAASFDFDESTRQLSTLAALDFEATDSYSVTIQVDDGNGGTDTVAVTIAVTNVDEPPTAPAAPSVAATSGSTTSLDVTWIAPGNDGRPEITSYDLRYRVVGDAGWTAGPQDEPGTSATIDEGLTANTDYEVQVLATNDEGDSDWSASGTGNTGNIAPVFGVETAARSVAENTPADTDIGAAFPEATDADGDTLLYTLEGADAASFGFDASTRQLRTMAALDFEAKPSYSVTMKADDDNGGSDTIAVTISVTNVDEPPDAPAAPMVAATADSATSLDVGWTAPASNGKPRTRSYDLRYRAGNSGPWTDGPQDVEDTSATLTGLAPDTSYQVQVRATNDEGDGDWFDAGTGTTGADDIGEGDTTAPEFVSAMVSGTELVLTFNEALDESSTPAAEDFEVQVTPSGGAPTRRGVTGVRVSGTTIVLTLASTVRPTDAVTVKYLSPGSESDPGIGDESDNRVPSFSTPEPATNDTPASNNAPVFADDTLTREVAENTAADSDIGAVIPAAADADGDTLTYTLEGTDADSFAFDATTRQIATKTGVTYDFEAKASYSVTIRVSDANGGTDTVEVTIAVTNLDEQAPPPDNPQVSTGDGSGNSLTVSWRRPDSNGGPAIIGYQVRYREGADGEWLFWPHEGTGASTTITGLKAETSYQVQVRSLNSETQSDWSAPMTGTTGAAVEGLSQGWLTRFGRTASDNTLSAIENRWRGERIANEASHLTLGGRQVNALFNWGGNDRTDGVASGEEWLLQPDGERAAVTGNAFSGGPGAVPGGLLGTAPGSFAAGPAGAGLSRALPELRDVLLGSSFFYSAPTDSAGDQQEAPGQWSLWGDIAASRFDGTDGALTLDGEVATGTVGADLHRGRWLGGVALSYSEGEGSYRRGGADEGALSSELASVNPFVRYEHDERTSVWGVLGYGSGEWALTPEGSGSDLSGDLTTKMAAIGGRGVLSTATGGFELAIRSDVRATETMSESPTAPMGDSGSTSRVRVLLEGTRSRALESGAVLGLTLEAGLRYDGGDAETGGGAEIGGALSYATGRLAVQANVRMLAAHEDEAYEEWGAGGSLLYRPRSDGSGLSVRLGSAWGVTESGVQSLWARQDARGLARGGMPMDAAQRFETELGYGIVGRRRTDVFWYPYFGAQGAGGGTQTLHLGLKLNSESRFEVGLEFGRRLALPGEKPENALMLQGSMRW